MLLAVAAFGCGGGEGGARSVSDVAGIVVESTPFLTIGVEEGDDAYQFERIVDALISEDGRILVADGDAAELRIFDSTGKHLGSLGRRGAGPMEFNEGSSGYLYTNGRAILAADEGAMRVHVLSPDLSFRETRRFTLYPDTPRPYLQGVATNGDWIVQAFANGGAIRGAPGQLFVTNYQLLRYDSTGAMLDTIIQLPMRPRLFHEYEGRVRAISIPLSAEPQFAVDGDRLIIVGGNAPALQIHALDGSVIGSEAWDRPRVRSADVWEEYKRQFAVSMSGQSDSARYANFHAQPLPLSEYAPLYTGVKLDPAGRIWLERFRMPLDSTRQWDVLDRDGKLLGAAETPRGVTVLRFGRDVLIGRSRDSLGVQRILLYRVRTATP
ncbi:hypothetical protein Strain138_000691 [Pseudogemmatithrix spongiicola]|uniref:6-bladed beta-propeller n=1 Tax=Pseudogemmatithrix spongiicola TaxID=3062599 RepID=A0AA49JY51_9BACT|nr:hypothetical protein Strain138_000691 [Gemmatimonadaceae bacterium 'strain 138']WKW14350.1 hypothetical protein Strain318_000691 [Gemmatimonadaceae bacterium 'strain 318']